MFGIKKFIVENILQSILYFNLTKFYKIYKISHKIFILRLLYPLNIFEQIIGVN